MVIQGQGKNLDNKLGPHVLKTDVPFFNFDLSKVVLKRAQG